jgi:hypothetical protein
MPEFRAQVGHGCGKPASAFATRSRFRYNKCSLAQVLRVQCPSIFAVLKNKICPKTSLDQPVGGLIATPQASPDCPLSYLPFPTPSPGGCEQKRFDAIIYRTLLFANSSLQRSYRQIRHYKRVAGKLFIANGLWVIVHCKRVISLGLKKPRRLTEAFLSLFLFY